MVVMVKCTQIFYSKLYASVGGKRLDIRNKMLYVAKMRSPGVLCSHDTHSELHVARLSLSLPRKLYSTQRSFSKSDMEHIVLPICQIQMKGVSFFRA